MRTKVKLLPNQGSERLKKTKSFSINKTILSKNISTKRNRRVLEGFKSEEKLHKEKGREDDFKKLEVIMIMIVKGMAIF